ncbi:hypothetical protein ACH5RR_029823 [Cinchona calisaya]|uniref:Cucumisin n=1 Tax=Cinchona calisaya TaxID=153742 RepID=A0ABD2YX51_9GENT
MQPVSTISAQVFGMVKGSFLEEVGVCVLEGRIGRFIPGAKARNFFDWIRSSRDIGYFFSQSSGNENSEDDLETEEHINQIHNDDVLTDSSDEITGKETNIINVYIVYMGSLPKREYFPSAQHVSMLEEVVDNNYLEKSLVRSYTRSFNGFAAYLTDQEQQNLAAHDDVVSIFPSKSLQLHTTASWDFIGLPQIVSRNLEIESDIIIGVFDTGIWPESESFNDQGFGPIPKKWKGKCNGGKNFFCNNKIIGARCYKSDSARDLSGHGTHTSSIAAGNNVINVSYDGIAIGCNEFDILAAFDDAIADGVDIITISIGSTYPANLKDDSIAIGSFHATQNEILRQEIMVLYRDKLLVPYHIWLFTVAASSTNRKIIAKVVLGNGVTLAGNAINSFKLNGTKFSLVYGKDASSIQYELKAKLCFDGFLDKSLVQGKIVVCCNYNGIEEARRVGALGSILLANEFVDVSNVVPFAASVLNHQQFRLAESYINSTRMPKANIFTSEITQNVVAPVIASFSSRDIDVDVKITQFLLPDISAPGVDILAAYSPANSPSEYPNIDGKSVNYNLLSGTSMACPHVTCAAAYLKSFHPNWSSSAIKSALMTTALKMNATNARHGDAEFSYGAGNLHPIKATNPGLVYEKLAEDYIHLICNALNFNASKVRKIFGSNTSCKKVVTKQSKDLNYPSMAAQVEKYGAFVVKFQRTGTNVGLSNSVYKATISETCQCNITVEPSILSFQALNERKRFTVSISGERVKNMISASLEWLDGIHTVRSPIVIYTKTTYH